MKSTGKYYVLVYNALEGYISNVVIANLKWVKCIKGEKNKNKFTNVLTVGNCKLDIVFSDIFGK